MENYYDVFAWFCHVTVLTLIIGVVVFLAHSIIVLTHGGLVTQ